MIGRRDIRSLLCVWVVAASGAACGHRSLDVASASDASVAPAGWDPVADDAGAGCEVLSAPPADCGTFATLCGNASALAAGGTTTEIASVVLTANDVFFVGYETDFSTCAGLFRVSKSGGNASRVRDASTLQAIEADATTVYLAEWRNGQTAYDLRALSDAGEESIGTIPTQQVGDTLWLANANGMVFAFSGNGGYDPAFFQLTPTALEPMGTVTNGNYLGSTPGFDGTNLYVSLSDGHDAGGALVELATGTLSTLGANASTRSNPTVAVSGTDVYFVTGDPESDDGVTPDPMGISRVSSKGGVVTQLVPSATSNGYILQLLVDDTDVYFLSETNDGYETISAVARDGSMTRTLWRGATSSSFLHQDADRLYFSIPASLTHYAEFSSPGGLVVWVPKSASL